jgi:hypothetical protein
MHVYDIAGNRSDSRSIFPNPYQSVERAMNADRRPVIDLEEEIIGAEFAPVDELLRALKAAGYEIEAVAVDCDPEESIRRNENRGDGISACYAEPLQRQWIVDACRSAGTDRPGKPG